MGCASSTASSDREYSAVFEIGNAQGASVATLTVPAEGGQRRGGGLGGAADAIVAAARSGDCHRGTASAPSGRRLAGRALQSVCPSPAAALTSPDGNISNKKKPWSGLPHPDAFTGMGPAAGGGWTDQEDEEDMVVLPHAPSTTASILDASATAGTFSNSVVTAAHRPASWRRPSGSS